MLVVIEGLDASGKGTQSELLKENLENLGYSVYGISLPNYDDNSSALVKMYLAGEMGTNPGDVNAYAASTFYAVDRYASFKKSWFKEYESKNFLVANRYTTSNCCHQMTKLDKSEWDYYTEWLYDFEYNKLQIPKPDLVIFLDMPVEVSQKLLMKRYKGDENKKDIHENDVNYLYHCREAALYAADKLGWKVISCAENEEPRSIEDISKDILKTVLNND